MGKVEKKDSHLGSFRVFDEEMRVTDRIGNQNGYSKLILSSQLWDIRTLNNTNVRTTVRRRICSRKAYMSFCFLV